MVRLIARLRRWWSLSCPECGEDLYYIGFGVYCFSDRCRKGSR